MWHAVLLFLPGQQPSISSRALRLVLTKMTNSNFYCWSWQPELQNPGILYVALSRAKTIGTVTPNNLHPKDSTKFWTGSGICLKRVLNITKKGHLTVTWQTSWRLAKDKIGWINLPQQNHLTSTKQYNEKWMKKIERKLPKNIQLLKRVELQRAIAEIITNPNKTWKNLKRERYMVPKSYFQINWTLNKSKKVLRVVLLENFLIWKKNPASYQ